MRSRTPALKFSGESFAPGYYGIGLRKEDATLMAALNEAIAELAADGTLERIYRKYEVWDERQEGICKDYQPELVTAGESHFHLARMAEVSAAACCAGRW